MMEVILVALIVSLIAPTVLAIISGRQRREEKREDWRREDAVAAKALIAAKKAADVLEANNRTAAVLAKNSHIITNEKLDVIHALVNSNMTAALQAELDSYVSQVLLLKEIAELKSANGVRPSIDSDIAIKLLENKIAELTATLKDRLQQ